MIVNNKLDKSFGPVGSFAGIVVFAAGLGAFYFSIFAIVLVLFGAFIGFTYSSTLIDFDKKRIRFSNNYFGLIKTGQWMKIRPDMKIGIKKSNQIWRSYSGGNRTLDIANKDYRLLLFNREGKLLMPVKKNDSLDSAKTDLEKICTQLEISPVRRLENGRVL